MKKLRIILFLGFGLLALGSSAQINVRDAFLTMPDTLCPFLDKVQRYYLLTAAAEGTLDTVQNRFNGESSIIELQPNVLRVHIAEGVEYDLLIQTDTITLIQTVCAPICASVVKQYDSLWQYLRTIHPSITGMLIEAELRGEDIVYKDNTPDLLDEDEKQEYKQKEQ